MILPAEPITGPAWRSICIVLVLVAVTWLAIADLRVPDALLTEDRNGISIDRAMSHVHTMATEPHPTGSERNRQVREYILNTLKSFGYAPEIQEAISIDAYNTACYLENIIASKKGDKSSGAVLIVGHYDSVRQGPGASDNLAAVAAMLETARSLWNMPVLNDVIFLFTDGEEIGLKGARAFVDKHPLAGDIGVVLNFEARGISGPSIMFETGGKNGALIRSLARTAFPVAYSWSYEVYSLMRNNTDFSVFKNKGIQGLNFAFIGGGFTHYHRMLDTAENLDVRSLAHHGNYMRSLVTSLSRLDLSGIEEQNRVYFRLPGVFVHYQYRLVPPITAGITGFFILVCGVGFTRKKLKILKVLSGILSLPLLLVTASGLVYCSWRAIRLFHPQYYEVFSDGGYSAIWYIWAFSLLTVLVCLLLLGWIAKRIGAANLFAGLLCAWCAGSVLSAFFVPGGSYMFAWPLLFGSCALYLLIRTSSSSPVPLSTVFIQLILALPVIVLVSPVIVLIFEAMGLNLAFVTATVLTVLVLSMMVPLVEVVQGKGWEWLSGVLGGLVIAALLGGSWFSRFDEEHPKAVNFRYHLNSDLDRGLYVVDKDSNVGDWLPMPFVGVTSEERPSRFLSEKQKVAKATAYPGSGAKSSLIAVDRGAGSNSAAYTLRLDGDVAYWGMLVRATRNSVAAAWLDGEPLRVREGQLKLRLQSFPPQGYTLRVEIDSTGPLVLDTMTWRGLESDMVPDLPHRPAYMVPHGDLFTVEKSIILNH